MHEPLKLDFQIVVVSNFSNIIIPKWWIPNVCKCLKEYLSGYFPHDNQQTRVDFILEIYTKCTIYLSVKFLHYISRELFE